MFIEPLEKIFIDSYATVHRLETNKLRNVARFFAHLLFTDSISWNVLSTIHLNEEETTSSSRIYIKILFQELAEHMGLNKLNARVQDPLVKINKYIYYFFLYKMFIGMLLLILIILGN